METMVMKNQKKWRETGLDILGDFAGALLQAVGVWCFIEPSRIAPGGVSGIALMINHLFGLPIGALSLAINIPLLLASWLLLNRGMTLKTIRTVICMSVMMVLWEKKSVNVKTLGENLYLDSGTLTPLLKRLETKGLIRRARSHSDERALDVSITEKGEALREDALDIPQEINACMQLQKDEIHALYTLLYKTLDGVEASIA